MRIMDLSYAVIGASDPEQWRAFASDILGAMAIDGPEGCLDIKLDERCYRLLVVKHDSDRLLSCGWGVNDEPAFADARRTLSDAGVEIADGTTAQLAARRVAALFSFTDPGGNVHEICCGPSVDPRRFISPVGVHSFVTGAGGFGHAVLPVGNRLDETVAFWRDLCGMRTGNGRSFVSPGQRVRTRFLACNERHHSIAFAESDAPARCLHLNLEVKTLDDVGYAFDRAEAGGWLARSLGRHINDGMVSFYMRSPGGFQIEYGYSPVKPTWPEDFYYEDTVGSYWGHKWLPGENPIK